MADEDRDRFDTEVLDIKQDKWDRSKNENAQKELRSKLVVPGSKLIKSNHNAN